MIPRKLLAWYDSKREKEKDERMIRAEQNGKKAEARINALAEIYRSQARILEKVRTNK